MSLLSNANGGAVPATLRGPVERDGGRICIGRVGAPGGHEANSEKFTFWVPPDALVEKTQLVTCESRIGGQTIQFYAMVEEVHRTSRGRSMGGEMDGFDGDLNFEPPFGSEGCTYATASILRTDPPLLTPPRERSEVLLAGTEEASYSFRTDEIGENKALAVGLIKNGGTATAGPGYIDLDYLLGANGGHMNVNGAAGRGTKSSFLMWINYLLLRKAKAEQVEQPSSETRLRIVPIILNVKNFDLFYIDRQNRKYLPQEHRPAWIELGIDAPGPFENATFYAAQQVQGPIAIPTGRVGSVLPYSWSLSDIIERGLLEYLFAENDAKNQNFSALVLDIQNYLTRETVNNDGSVRLAMRTDAGRPTNFDGFLQWVESQTVQSTLLPSHQTVTWKMLHRRLIKIIYESRGVLRRTESQGNPLDLVRGDTTAPMVVDLAALAGEPELQRFVVATILRQLIEARTGSNAIRNLKYIVTLDELNRFAPHGSKDPITRLIETVAAEMRSQGIILLGAQQQASKVSERVIENAAIRVVGKSGPLELSASVWRILSESARRKAENLGLDEKLVIQDNFREPMHVRVPFPAWALNPDEVDNTVTSGGAENNFDDLMDSMSS